MFVATTRVSAALLPISDEFDIPGTVSNWNRINVTEGWNADQLQVWDINASQSGRMVMKPYAVTWYQDYRGPLVYKTLGGNFSLTTQVEVRNGAGQSVTPAADYSLAGVMLRGPRNITDAASQWTAGGEDYVFLSLGFGNSGVSNGPQFEVKTTNDSDSNLQLAPALGLTATLQLTRLTNSVGTFVIAALKEPNSDWIIHRRYRRDDLVGTLQAGLVTYSDYSTASLVTPFVHNGSVLTEGSPLLSGHVPHPDLTAGFDYARYFDLGTLPAGLASADLLNTDTIPNSVLLQLLAPGPAPPTGDYNQNLVVDAADYALWRQAMTNGDLNADGDRNSVIDSADYDIWRSHFGGTASGAALLPAVVPEPSYGRFMICFAAAAAFGFRGHRGRRTAIGSR
jgi:hypothetical protein